MGWMDRRRSRNDGPDVVALMERFGRHEIDTRRSSEPNVWEATQQPFLSWSQSDPAGLIQMLADTCVPVGGWAVYGAERTVVNLVGVSPPGESWLRILDGSTEFLRSNFVPPMRIPPYQWNRFIDLGGTSNTWIPLRPPPDRAEVRITPVGPDELRPVVRMGPEADANVVLVRRTPAGYEALIDARWSDDDPTRSQSEWKQASDLYDLYLDVAWSCQVWGWADPEIEPFFPAPPALI